MLLNAFLDKLRSAPGTIDFNETMAVIEEGYVFSETAFVNGEQENKAGENSGSCKLFAFAKSQDFNEAQTLACFGQYYRDDVLKTPHGTDHQNIRQFMSHGWQGITFLTQPLADK